MSAISFNPMDPEFVADPYPTYHRLRAEDPVHHSPLGFWMLTRYEDVVAVLRDARFAKEAIATLVAARFGVPVPAGVGGGPEEPRRPPGPRRLLPRAHRGAPDLAAGRHALGPHRRRGSGRHAERERAARHVHPPARRRPRDHGQPDRQRHPGAPAPS